MNIFATAFAFLCLYGVEANTHSKKWTQKNVAKAYLKASTHVDAHLEHHLSNVKSTHGVQLQNTNYCQYTTFIDCNANTCAACVAKGTGWYWVGYCTTSRTDFMGAVWGVDVGNTDCTVPQVGREWTISCEDATGQETEGCNSTLVSVNSYKGVSLNRMDSTIHSDLTLIDPAVGQFDTAGIYNSLAFEFVNFMLHGGHATYTEGPPALYQSAGYVYVPKGGFTQGAAARLTGSNTFVVFDSGYKYNQADYTSGVGSTTNFAGVSFTQLLGSVTNLTILGGSATNKNATVQVCSSGNTVCLSMTVSAKAFTKEGLSLDDSSSKVDVYVNNIAYSGQENSYGFRMMSVSTSYSGSVSLDDTGNGGNEESETMGAAFLITESSAYASSSAISSSNPGTTTASVQKQNQLAGTTGSNCGFTSSDWFASSAVDTSTNTQYPNAAAFFEGNGMRDMRCLFYSFSANNAAQTYFLWDPILGIDKDAARANALGSSSSSSSSSGNNAGVIAGIVVGVVCGVALIAGLLYYFLYYKKKTASAPAPGNAL